MNVAGDRRRNQRFQPKHACIAEAPESTSRRLESAPPEDHEDHIAEKGFNSISHYKLVHKFVPMPQAMEILDAKAAVDKEWEKSEKLPAWQLTKVKSQKEVILETHREKSPLCYIDGHLASQECGVSKSTKDESWYKMTL